MGQKSNLITIRKTHPTINLESLNSKQFASFLKYFKMFETLARRKGILIFKQIFNISSGTGYFNIAVFFQSTKRSYYKRRGFIKKVNLEDKSIFFNNNIGLQKLFVSILKNLRCNFLSLSLQNLNRSVNDNFLNFFSGKMKRFSTTIFSRRYNLLIDFLKTTSLLVKHKISSHNYITILSLIFSSLSKKAHSQFLFFLKYVFKLIIDLPKHIKSDIHGIKLIAKGKLQGKPRASTAIVQEGSIPNQSLSKNIDYSKSHSYTLMGAFGLKLWIYRK
jgi:hypothetical protein